MAQKKFFEEALQHGRQKAKPYVLLNERKKLLSKEDVIKYAKEKDYLLGEIEYVSYNQFGRPVASVYKMPFIPNSEVKAFVYELLNKDSNVGFSQLSQSGSGFCYHEEKFFKRNDGIKWSGNISNGMISGTGIGFVRMDADSPFIWFKGTFENGFPVGEVTYRWAEESSLFNTTPDKFNQKTLTTGKMSDGMMSFLIDRKYGFISNDGTSTIPPRFKSIVKDFTDGIAYVTEDKMELKIDKKGQVVDVSESVNLSYSDLVSLKKVYPGMQKAIESRVIEYAKQNERTLFDLERAYKEFPGIASQIEDLALNYVQQSNRSFDDLLRAATAFPSIASQVEKLKEAKYNQNVQEVQQFYQEALAAARSRQTNVSGMSKVKDYIYFYDKYNYDPKKTLPMARELMDYYTVCKALVLSPKIKYWGYNDGVPYMENGEDQLSQLSKAQKLCEESSSTNFKDFYAHAKSIIPSKRSQIYSAINKSRSDYDVAYKKYQEEVVALERKLKSINASTIYSYVIREDKKWDSTDIKHVMFRDFDGREFTVAIQRHQWDDHPDWDYYRVLSNNILGEKYRLYTDALICAFLSKYEKEWDQRRSKISGMYY